MLKLCCFLMLISSSAFSQSGNLIKPGAENNPFSGLNRSWFSDPGRGKFIPFPGDQGQKQKMDAMQRAYGGKLTGYYSHSTANGGSVYRMPPDGMACLVHDPALVEKMPGSTPREILGNAPMPNAIPRTELLPHQDKPAN